MEDVIIVGAGPAGMMAAITAAKMGAKVLLLERMKKAGIKLSITGNGRCNFTNAIQRSSDYRGTNPEFGYKVASTLPVASLITLFESLGIYAKNKGGYYYPRSEQASVVAELLSYQCYLHGVTMCFEHMVKRIEQKNQRYRIIATVKGKEVFFDAKKVIIATGGMTFEKTGSDGMGYKFAKKLGHEIISPTPVLCGLVLDERYKEFLAAASGVRARACVSCVDASGLKHEEDGELQMTAYGISGIPAFILSRYILCQYERQRAQLTVDFLPDYSMEQLELLCEQGIKWQGTMERFLWGLFPQKLATALTELYGISPKEKLIHFTKESLYLFMKNLKKVSFIVNCGYEKEQAQVTAGGVDTTEVNIDTMESVIHKGLYFCGEVLDVDGSCGGYNLHFAFSSGIIAGRAASQM